MTEAVGILNLVLGAVYTSYGVMTIVDMKRGWRTMGFSHFGAAWTAMAFTCGPHHLAHGATILTAGHDGGSLDLLAVVVGFPAGVAWFLLRIEAFVGGRGDRAIAGSPAWVRAIPFLSTVYLTFISVVGLQVVLHDHDARGSHSLADHGLGLGGVVWPNLMLLGLYMTIGYVLTRTQLTNHRLVGGWSLSGLSLAVIFPTCALMHTAYALYVGTGLYAAHSATLWIDWLAVPAAAYFLWVVYGLYRDTIRDWNRPSDVGREAIVAGSPLVAVPSASNVRAGRTPPGGAGTGASLRGR